MFLRSAVLVACLAIVPLLAMFSHKLPRDWRRFASRPATTPAEPAATSIEPVAAAEPTAAAEPVATQPSVAAAPAEPASPAVPAMLPAPAAPPAPAAVEAQLRALGAVSIECVALPGGSLHRCSCRVSADPSGQLQRVFQTSNADPAVALRNLLGQVQFWRHRLAAQGQPPLR